jgi:outer membrane lipoprotein SlyB
MTRLPKGRAKDARKQNERTEIENGGIDMANKEFELTPNVYMFAGVGAVVIGGLAAFALGGVPNTIAAAVVGGLAGGCLGLFF